MAWFRLTKGKSRKRFRLRRGLYALAPPYRKVIAHPFLIANRLEPGSYVSGLSALAYANAIPEFVAEVTSCGPGRLRIRETSLGRFSFRYLKPQLRGRYRLIDLGGGQSAFVASLEKAFLDLVHLQPGGDDHTWIDGLRLNLEALSVRSLGRIAAATGSPKLKHAAAHLDQLDLTLLNAAIRQTDAEAEPLDEGTWRVVVAERVAELLWDAVVADVRPFLERGEEMVGKGDVMGLLEGRSR